MEARAHRSSNFAPVPRSRRYAQTLADAVFAPGPAGWLLLGVFAVIVYAAFANGATAIDAESKVQLALALGLLGAGAGIAWGGLGAARSNLAWAGTGLLGLFVLYSALSVEWSIAPDETWTAANRAAAYVVVLAIVLVAAPSVPRAPEKALYAFLCLAVTVALYGLASKLFPTLPFAPAEFEDAAQFSRLRLPVGYWNALGMLMVLAVPAALWVAGEVRRPPGVRIAALACLEIFFVVIALTYSRGALLALVVALATMLIWGPNRGHTAAATVIALLTAAVPIAFAFSRDDLSRDGIAAADRAGDGGMLALVLAGSLLVAVGIAQYLLRAEDRYTFVAPARFRGRMRMALLAAAVVTILVMALSPRGLTGTVSHQWDQFTEPAGIDNDPGRLLSSNSSNRWIWWQEASGAFSDRPLAGWGAGSFPILHNQYREYPSQVRSTHDLPLQFLSETGLIGTALGLGGIAMLFGAAVQRVRSSRGESREARIALIAAAAAWLVHCLVDFDWEIPALTLPALAALAIAATPWQAGHRWLDPNPPRDRRRRIYPRLAVPVGLTAGLAAIVFGISAALPARAEDMRLDALRIAAGAGEDRAELQAATGKALDAHNLNPLDEDAAFSAASLEARSGDLDAARAILIDAARTQPENYRVWDMLLDLATTTNDEKLAATAFQHRLATEPLSFAQDPDKGAGAVWNLAVPAEASPTAFGAPPTIPSAG